MTIIRTKERYDKYKQEVKTVWTQQYEKHIVRTVHQAGNDAESNIKLAELETDLFLNPEEEKCIRLHDDTTIRRCAPTFMKEFYKHPSISPYVGGDLGKCNILDYGCGSLARYATAFAKRFAHVLAVDSCPKALENAKQYTHKFGNITLHESNGIDLDGIESESQDVVFSNLVFQHVGNKEVLIDLINECFRVLKQPGVMRASFWTEERSDEHQDVYNGTGFSMEGYKEIFEEAGFGVECMTHEYPVLWVTLARHES